MTYAPARRSDVCTTAAPANGELDRDQLRETAVHLAHYAGWAIGAKVSNVAEAVIARADAARRGS